MILAQHVSAWFVRFIEWCREANMKPFIILNMGTGTLAEALHWIEYCNGTGDTYVPCTGFSARRFANICPDTTPICVASTQGAMNLTMSCTGASETKCTDRGKSDR